MTVEQLIALLQEVPPYRKVVMRLDVEDDVGNWTHVMAPSMVEEAHPQGDSGLHFEPSEILVVIR